MAASYVEKGAAALAVGTPLEVGRAGNQTDTKYCDPKQEPTLNRLLDDLAVIADWKTEIAAKIKRAQLRFDLIGLDPDEQDELADEVQDFNRLCLALGQSISGRAA